MEKDSSTAMSIFDVFTSTGIEMDQLPKTVQDAIVVCRELGVDYLWVDALCIIQEQRDLEDFKVEALKMSQYYENAYLTLIVGSAPDCADGFLNDLPEPKASPCEIGYGRMTLGTLYPESDMKGVVKLSLPRDSAKGPLSKRAWPFQEEKLSRRTLTYASEMVLFSCQTMSVNEEGSFSIIPSATADPATFDPHHFDLHTPHDLTTHDDNSKSQELAFDRWRQSLILYTELQMSNSMDKLAAIAGYAKFLGSVIRCKYMYGLWKDDLHVELLWKSVYATSTLKCVTRAVDRAPSWSWASIDGRVSMSLSPPMRDMIQNPKNQRLAVLDCKNISGSYDPIRANKSGSRGFELNVRGPLTTLWPAQKWGKYKQEYVSLRANADGEEIAVGSWDTLKDYQSKQYLDYMIYALLVVRGKGLLLAKIQGSDHYRRIGTFRSLEKEDIFIRDQEIIII
ncbi:hypothetical protein EPUS_05982 [Endocarpon pusillum Z07020]|uniref:Heterokaryon incompatibility domain-containing protein n=1 Tax=Endocarpon pusillum (strain Z07020 / HMAS-L-300199) TaxID=1263415 RepID=U1GGD3_ENDPU|nr:uncharacterized protein EPUS_05982 [Endocarpon pusillum Z07020]ERF71153.1 hypothetical protein EPUS_05982 [Endocarpon pusillum Z07020]